MFGKETFIIESSKRLLVPDLPSNNLRCVDKPKVRHEMPNKEKLKGWHGVVHETPEVQGSLETINEPILHFTHRNLEQMVAKTNDWSEYEANLRVRTDHPKMNFFRFIRVMATGFTRSYIFEKGYKNRTAGLIESVYQAFSMFITYAKLWEKQQARK